ncbi:MAG: YggT family protein [Candidatus Hydrogenedentota bacterium]
MEIAVRVAHSGITIYMILILLRWLAPHIGLELEYGRFRFLTRVVDPFLDAIRKSVPVRGPFDASPIIALFACWFVRTILVRILIGTLPVVYV